MVQSTMVGSDLPPVVNDAEELAQWVEEHFREHLPEPTSFPSMATRIMDLAEHPDVDVTRLSHLIERDPGVCTAVLKLANSALNRRSTPVNSVRQAVTLLGLKKVANAAVGVACRALFDMEARIEHDLFPGWWERLFHCAMTEAFCCSFVAMAAARKASDGIFLAGLLHDVGKSLALRSLAALVLGGKLALPDNQTIESVLSATRANIGALALGSFNLPRSLALVCLHQDEPALGGDEQWIDCHIVRVVAGINELRLGREPRADLLERVLGSARALQMEQTALLGLASQLSDHSAQVQALFSTNDGASDEDFPSTLNRILQQQGNPSTNS
jgi:HD-like signal output (HDOD) protein